MYMYVKENQIAPYKSFCQRALDRLCEKLKAESSIAAHAALFGSGAQNMVTKNGKGAFDLDYNLVFDSIPREYASSPGALKNLVRISLDKLVSESFPRGGNLPQKKAFSHGKDSTSSITYILHASDGIKAAFKFDVALILETENGYSRLIHDKEKNLFLWNQIPQSGNMKAKLAAIKSANRFADVREVYLQKKNTYLSRQDRNHPSFIVYLETVNQVYQNL